LYEIRLFREQDDGWIEEAHLDQHGDWVRDVAWAPTFSFNKDKIASCSQVMVSFDSKKKSSFLDFRLGWSSSFIGFLSLFSENFFFFSLFIRLYICSFDLIGKQIDKRSFFPMIFLTVEGIINLTSAIFCSYN